MRPSSTSARDAAMKAMLDDPRMKEMDMPFDATRMIVGGFETIFDTAAGSG